MALLSRSQMIAAKLPHRDVLVPEMGENAEVRVQQMSVNTRANFLETIRLNQKAKLAYEEDQAMPVAERQGIEEPPHLDTGILAITLSLVDEDGAFLFTPADAPLLKSWSNNATTRIWAEITELNLYTSFEGEQVATEKKD